MFGLGEVGQHEAAVGAACRAKFAVFFGEQTGGEKEHFGVDDGDALPGDGLPHLGMRIRSESKRNVHELSCRWRSTRCDHPL